MKKAYFILILLFLIVGTASADSLQGLVTRYTTQDCPQIETAGLSLKFQSVERSAQSAIEYIDNRLANIDSLLVNQEEIKYVIKSTQFNVQAIDSRQMREWADDAEVLWQVSGTISIEIESAQQAKRAFLVLSQNKFKPSLHIQTKPQARCPQK